MNKAFLTPVSKSSLQREIVEQLQERILTGDLKAGEKLPTERQLADGLQVNRGTLREALKKLEHLGLVEILHGDGIYIKDYLESGNLELLSIMLSKDGIPHRQSIEGLLLVRRFLAPEITRIAIKKADDEAILKLESIINNDIMAIEEIDIEVHNFIARTSGVLIYIFILNFFNQLIRDNSSLFFNNTLNSSLSKKFHKDLLECFKKGDADSAAHLVSRVLLKVEHIIFENYDKSSQ